MKTKLLLSTLFGVAAWSLSSLAMANWDTGACPGSGTAPCIETEINGNTYHFNGTGGHAGVWHGRPAAEGGGDFEFEGDDVFLDCSTDLNCTLNLTGEVKKCQDSSGEWRLGVRVNASDVSAGDFLCSLVDVGGFPWYSKDPSIASHCPFEDDCDSFIPYDSSASAYAANFGTIDVSVLGTNLVDSEHLHSVIFTPGNINNPGEATFNFQESRFFNCEEEEGCLIDGVLTLDNATSLEIY